MTRRKNTDFPAHFLCLFERLPAILSRYKTLLYLFNLISHYPFDCSKAFFSKANDDDHWKGEANGEEEEIVAKVIWSSPGWATARIR